MLHNLHYYPLFNKDTFHPHEALPGKERSRGVGAQNEGAIEVSQISPISPSAAPLSPSSGQTEIEKETLKLPMEKLWEFVNENQVTSTYKPSRYDLHSSEMSSKAPTLAFSSKGSKSQDITSFMISNEYTDDVGNNVNLQSKQQPSSGDSVIVTLPNSSTEVNKSGINLWQSVAIGALGVGLATFGAFIADFIFRRLGRKAAKVGRKRQINTSDDDIVVRANW